MLALRALQTSRPLAAAAMRLLATEAGSKVPPSSPGATKPMAPSAGEAWVRRPLSAQEKASERFEFEVKVPKPVRPVDEPLDKKRARLLYATRKRGILECDLLLSTYITRSRLDAWGAMDLQQLDDLLEENDWDLFGWLVGQKPVPKEVQAYTFWGDLVEHSKNKRKDILRMPALEEK
ncbi:Flavinator of succinate dehydrogenase-domain-containing protein [Chytriomyces sp. MP71]|nr:Flavinator of succinate dehydrogenase-domain-containing protein [Chytriomyces sp. MP71]